MHVKSSPNTLYSKNASDKAVHSWPQCDIETKLTWAQHDDAQINLTVETLLPSKWHELVESKSKSSRSPYSYHPFDQSHDYGVPFFHLVPTHVDTSRSMLLLFMNTNALSVFNIFSVHGAFR